MKKCRKLASEVQVSQLIMDHFRGFDEKTVHSYADEQLELQEAIIFSEEYAVILVVSFFLSLSLYSLQQSAMNEV